MISCVVMLGILVHDKNSGSDVTTTPDTVCAETVNSLDSVSWSSGILDVLQTVNPIEIYIERDLINTCVQDGTREARVVQWDARSYIQESGNFLSIPQ